MNLNGDYIFDVLAVMVGGIGIVFGVNFNDIVGMFEVIYGIVFKYVGLDKVNLGFIILSVEMMLRYMGWVEAVDLIVFVMEKVIKSKRVIYDFVCLMDGVKEVKCFEFVSVMIENM